MATLIVVGKRSTREHPITDHVTVIGRDEGVNLDLGDLQVSRRHALVVQASQGYFVKDLGSRNGMTLNQQRIPPRQQAQLKNGDVLSMGRTTLIFKDLVRGGPMATVERPSPVRNELVAPSEEGDDAAPDAPLEESGELELEPLAEEAPRRTPLSVEITSDPETETPNQVEIPAPKSPAPRKTPSGAIPRALPPGGSPPVYSGQAEVVTLRALMERAERDRVFYRNLSLILFCLLIGTLVILFAWALLNRDAAPNDTSSAQKAAPTPAAPALGAPGADTPAAGRLDPQVFASAVHPVLKAKCVQCHDGSGNGGGLLLASADDAQTIAANRAAVRPFVVPGQPQKSALLLKPIAPTEGGAGSHPVVLAVASREWKAMQAWVARTVEGSPPRARIAAPTRARLGQPIALDGSRSVDPDGESLRYRWSLVESPARSKARIQQQTAKAASLEPDLPGRYIVALVVQDGSGSGSTTHTVVVLPGAGGAPAKPAGEAPGRDLTATFRRLLGRSPSAAEQARVAKLHGRELHAFFLAQRELYECWWAGELTYLGLIGEHAPKGEPWDSLPTRLRGGKYSVADVHYALLVGSSWRAVYPGRDAYVDALLKKLIGHQQVQANLRRSAQRLFDGYEASLLGKTVKGQIGLVRAVVHSPQARRHLVRRSYRSLVGRDPSSELVDACAARLAKQPSCFFRLLVEWGTPPG